MPDPITHTKDFKPRLESVHAIQSFVREALKGKISEKVQLQIDLVIEEVSVNIIKYGLKDRTDGVIRIEMSVDEKRVDLCFIDNGIAFNPLTKEAPDITSKIEDRKPGGLGVFIVKQFASSISYDRKEEYNRLSLTINFNKS